MPFCEIDTLLLSASHWVGTIDIKKVDKQLNVYGIVCGTIRYGHCSRNPLSCPLLFIYNNIYLYIYIY